MIRETRLAEIQERQSGADVDDLIQFVRELQSHARNLWPVVNRRRGDLIDREIQGTISESESAELAGLQVLADEHLDCFFQGHGADEIVADLRQRGLWPPKR